MILDLAHIHLFPIIYEPILSVNLVFILIVLFSKKSPSKSLSWLLVLYFIPPLGIFLYLFFGIPWRRKSIINRLTLSNQAFPQNESYTPKILTENLTISEHVSKRNIFNIASATTNLPVYLNNELTVYADTTIAFENMLDDIRNAKHHIHFESYIFRGDNTGKIIKELLISKANENVEVKIVIDAYGSLYSFNRSFFRALEEHDKISVAVFQPVKFPFVNLRSNYRNHRKMLIIDGKIGYIGSMNIGDEYLGLSKKFGYWRDTVIKIMGDSVKNIQTIFFQDWYFAKKEKFHRNNDYFPQLSDKVFGHNLVQIVGSSPLANWDTIHQLYFESIASAESSLYITTPYFIPDEPIMMALKTAALGGADVKLLIPGKADHILTYLATSSFIEEVLLSGVEVYYYEKYRFVHSKVITVDNIFASIGSANLDQRSLNINFEINALIYNKDVVAQINKDFLNDLSFSKRIYYEDIKNKHILLRGAESLARLLSPIL